jgi:TonB-dependent starch-binding outer membrane protein SusC
MKSMHSFVLLLLLVVITSAATARFKLHTIHGRVTSFEESLAIEGVSVKIKGTQYVTGTQADGTFSLDVADEKQVLVFESSEYETQEIPVGTKKEFNIVLKRKENAIVTVDGQQPFVSFNKQGSRQNIF